MGMKFHCTWLGFVCKIKYFAHGYCYIAETESPLLSNIIKKMNNIGTEHRATTPGLKAHMPVPTPAKPSKACWAAEPNIWPGMTGSLRSIFLHPSDRQTGQATLGTATSFYQALWSWKWKLEWCITQTLCGGIKTSSLETATGLQQGGKEILIRPIWATIS